MRLVSRMAAVATVIIGAGLVVSVPVTAAPPSTLADGSYVVEFRDKTDAGRIAAELNIAPTHVYTAAVSGFAAELTTEQIARLQARDDFASISRNDYLTNVLDTTQAAPPAWGIDRLDQRFLPLSNNYTYWNNGSGIRVYVIDTGIDVTHPEFGARAGWMHNSIDANNTDCNSHGTHVAGTVGGLSYGVAKNVYLRAVKALDCGGGTNLAALIGAVDWVTANAIKPAIANTSWNWPFNNMLRTSLVNMINSGVYLTASAGNTGADSCDRLPRQILAGMVVANSTSTDARSATSSTGACVDIYAPGTSIRSALPGGGNGLKSGTSMAAPHVAGIAALYKDQFGDVSQAVLNAWIIGCATPGVVGGALLGTPNRLANTCGL